MMRALGVAVVILGMAALACIVIDATQTPDSGSAGQPSELGAASALQRLILWAAFMGIVVAATLFHALGELVMTRREQKSTGPAKPPNGETAAMIEAEVNEGGPPSSVPCDTPFERTACLEQHAIPSEEQAASRGKAGSRPVTVPKGDVG